MDPFSKMTALELGRAIAAGRLDPVALAEALLEQIPREDADGRIFVRLLRDRTLDEAHAARARAWAGLSRSPLDGVPVAWKDNVETAGAITAAGSALLRNHVPARDAGVLARATRAGLVFLGKTNLTEFAFSGLGINPTTGTPAHPFDLETVRIPGGSSSGSAVAVARGLAPLAVGTDTGGSVRIPAAWNGLVGLETTAGRIATQGVIPLSPRLDTVGPLARTVADAAALDAILAGMPAPDLAGLEARRLRLFAPTSVVVEQAEAPVQAAFAAALEVLRGAGVVVEEGPLPAFAAMLDLYRRHGTPVAAEAGAVWRERVEAAPDQVYAFIRERFREVDQQSALDLARFYRAAEQLGTEVFARFAGFDAAILPTVALRPAPLSALESDADAYARTNARVLTNTALVNFLGGAALSLPAGWTPADAAAPALPFGVMLAGVPGSDRRLLRIAQALEPVLSAPA